MSTQVHTKFSQNAFKYKCNGSNIYFHIVKSVGWCITSSTT